MSGVTEPIRRSPMGSGLLLAAFSFGAALILSLSDEVTRAPIAARASEDLTTSLAQVVPEDLHDNDLSADIRVLDDRIEGPVQVHVATRNGAVTGAAFSLTGSGYSGAIDVLIGVDRNGSVLGVRVLSHAETPGLGDKIEARKSDWIHAFAGRSLTDPGRSGWGIVRDGGVFDQFSGASITPRAVVGTVHRGLELYARHRTELLETEDRP